MPPTTQRRPDLFTEMERMEAKKSYLQAKIAESRTAIQYSRAGQRYHPLVPACGVVEAEIATRAACKIGIPFDEALVELRHGYAEE